MSAVRKAVSIPRYESGDVAYARYRKIPGADHVIVTNDAGRFHLLPQMEFDRMMHGDVDAPNRARLAELGFLRSAPKVDVLADRLRERRAYLACGPSLHIMI